MIFGTIGNNFSENLYNPPSEIRRIRRRIPFVLNFNFESENQRSVRITDRISIERAGPNSVIKGIIATPPRAAPIRSIK